MTAQEAKEAELAALETGLESVKFAGKSPERVKAYEDEIKRVQAEIGALAPPPEPETPVAETAAVEAPEKAVRPAAKARKPAAKA